MLFCIWPKELSISAMNCSGCTTRVPPAYLVCSNTMPRDQTPSIQCPGIKHHQYNAPGSNTINNIIVNQVKASSRPPVVETDDDSDDTDDGIEDSAVIPAPLYRTQCKRKEGACQLHRCKFFHNSQLGEYGDIRDSLPKNPMEVKMLEIQG
ncbi:hypothetical protein HBH70_114330 [Parastagonospora nodorum]|nr:hypothetical protein HBH53_021810 [Parastagonospora nodorum]KAH4073943.1 hypothetical protein HBH50_040310 [Parastagonospora nodorum]KAH4091456.1 hypothetical protein HBH48_092630 [Parastagonospora nodorum]KAH4417704.1 hypothetical protein HBH92_049680 [Parastagonospora nodorum]KAH4449935.1 hypothetical protein HBH93_039470 [Parastagonospora nodorum]